MLRNRSKFKNIHFEERGFRRDLERSIVSLMHGSMREWLRGALTQNDPGYFPVWSGMAKSSFLPLAEYLGLDFSVTPKERAPDRRSEGRAMGRQGDFLTIARNQYGAYKYQFNWETEVPHFIFLEMNPHPFVRSAPWHSMRAGNRAAQAYLDANTLRRIPQIMDYVYETDVSASGGSA